MSARSSDNARSSNGTRKASNGTRSSSRRVAPAEAARQAAAELADLLARAPEAIVSLDRTDDGWRVGVEVLETKRIPDTADVLAEYEVDADERGQLVGYRRVRRYPRGRAGETR